MKQREGPLCPCCRRDFIVDPFDLLEEEANRHDETAGGGGMDRTGTTTVLAWDPAFLAIEDDNDAAFNLGPFIVGAPSVATDDLNDSDNASTDIEEGMGFNSSSVSEAFGVLIGGEGDSYEASRDDATTTSIVDQNANVPSDDRRSESDSVA